MEPPPSDSASSTKLRLDVTDRAEGTTCLTINGDIDMTTSDHFTQTLMRLVAEPAVTSLVLDVAHLTFMDSNGVTVLVKAHRAAGERGISFRIMNTQDPIRGLLEMLGVYEFLTEAHPIRQWS
jgi:anti-sigma B factor antagonist